ncbi:hypothetical protein ABT147_35700 [Streptomyces sp. NPDC001868]|uniref:hypothetical protein n=1 Tax=Streptomyces sp. NPDC001868 TaxID=3154401 RepID=UPI00331DC0FB
MRRVIAPSVRIEQTRRRLARLSVEGLVDRITLPQAGRTRVRFPTSYGVQLVSEWPEMRGHRPSRTVSDSDSDPTAVRSKADHTLTVTRRRSSSSRTPAAAGSCASRSTGSPRSCVSSF